MAAVFKQKCWKCRKNFVLVSSNQKYVICYDCQKDELNKKIKDPIMAELFNIPEEFYKESSFLRSIKSNYLRFGELSEKQIEAFKKVVKEMTEIAKKKKTNV